MAKAVLAGNGNSARPEMITLVRETIVALASGQPPSAIAVVRMSGRRAFASASALVGELPSPRHASLRAIRRVGTKELIDRGLLICFAGPASATGEDVVEFHVHGAAAVVATLLDTLLAMPDVRMADPGEFTRRAFLNNRIDLAQAEALGDLLAAEGEPQRARALAGMEGALARCVAAWRETLIDVMAQIEGDLDFPDEAEEAESADVEMGLTRLCDEMDSESVNAAKAERVCEGLTVVLQGAPNVGKSSLLNALAGREAAIVAASPGTTRDLVHVDLILGGVPVRLTDTAGIRASEDDVELAGMRLSEISAANADLVLNVTDQADVAKALNAEKITLVTKIDLSGIAPGIHGSTIHVSAKSGAGIEQLVRWLGQWAAARARPAAYSITTSMRQRDLVNQCREHLRAATHGGDRLLQAEAVRFGLSLLDRLAHEDHREAVIDRIFRQLCIGK